MKFIAWVAIALCLPAAWAGASSPIEGFVETNGVRLQYLEWGSRRGPALILLHGLADNPHVFDDLAPAFADRFRVIAYARRGSGGSEIKAPYDVGTLTEDLRGLMDALGVAQADLIGWSAGGDEITAMAARHPARVRRIVYLDSGYDWTDPDFAAAIRALPLGFFERPAKASASLDAFRSYLAALMFPGLDDMQRLEANTRQKIVIQSDGSVRDRTPKTVVDQLYAALFANPARDYAPVKCPALAIYSEHLYDMAIADPIRRAQLVAYERQYWKPFQTKSVARIRRELENVEIARVPGAHVSFILTQRAAVVDEVSRFLEPR